MSVLDQAQAARAAGNVREAEKLYKQVVETPGADLRDTETALLGLGELYRDENNASGLAETIKLSRNFMNLSTAKAKTAKLIRTLLDHFGSVAGSQQEQVAVLQENIDWAKQEKRIFLKQSLESRLASLYLETQQYKAALALIDALLAELRRLDDKMILTEVHLLESRIYRGIQNFPKSKAALTSARTAANSIYCPPHLQAQLDMQAGILHAEDHDYTTAYSYFYEAFEATASADADALPALKYMLLCKIMLNLPEDVSALLGLKLSSKYKGSRDVESMRAVARAHQNRHLGEFEKALTEYKHELSADPTIRAHLAALYDTLLAQNLLRIVEPYSVIEIDYVSELVGQVRQAVEAKLSQMILDGTLHGVLDQGRGCLILFDEQEADESYGAAIKTLEQVGKVVDQLYAKTVRIQ